MDDSPVTPNPPLSEEQLRFFSEQEAIASERATKRTLRQAFVGYAILFFGVIALYLNGQAVSGSERDEIRNDGRVVAIYSCNARFNDRVEIREVLVQSKRAIERQREAGTISAAQAEQSIDFYNDRLAGLPLPDCRRADDALQTSDPDLPLPEARYPGDGKD